MCKLCEARKIFEKKGFSKSESIVMSFKHTGKMEDYAGDGKDCVSRKISILKDEHPDWKQDQIVAVALKHCGQSRNDK